ncbi:MAG: hypothetical protein MR270_00250 [Erysipelotrichaceae bacterium]|nr:hypothetical protein [Erysipelotrichaceae bacterium]
MNKKKIITILSIIPLLLVIIGLYVNDVNEATKYEYEVVAIKYPTSEKVIIADGLSSLRIRMKLTKNNEPVGGHTINIFASNGSLPSSRVVTAENGWFDFYYYPYLYVNEKVSPLEDVTIYFQDESNSKVFLIPAKYELVIPVKKPEESNNKYDWEGYEIIGE